MQNPVQFEPRKILAVLHKHDVKCVVLGGVASAIHGATFPTSDVDICPALTTGDLDNLAKALRELEAIAMMTDEPDGIPLDWTGRSLKKWLPAFRFLSLMTKYGQLDLIYRPDGTEGYKDLSRGAETKDLGGGVETRIAALEDIIRSKAAADRQRDREQLPTLRKLLEMIQG